MELFSRGGAWSDVGPPAFTDAVERLYFVNAVRLLTARGQTVAAEYLRSLPFHLLTGVNDFNDDFLVLQAAVKLATYERLRAATIDAAGKRPFREIVTALDEIVHQSVIRYVSVSLSLQPLPVLSAEDQRRALQPREIRAVMQKYIGVEGGYLGDFNQRTHREFYEELSLDVDPDEFEGTTRARFETILSTRAPAEQATILSALVERFPVGSSPLRTSERARRIRQWVARLRGLPRVAAPDLAVTSAVVLRALEDAEQLIVTRDAVSAVDRVHTALHVYLRSACTTAGLTVADGATIVQLLKNLETGHPAFAARGARAGDVRKVLRAMASIGDAFNPLRNDASVAHPNEQLLEPAEATLIVNTAYTLLTYLDAKLTSWAQTDAAVPPGEGGDRP